MRLSFFLGHAAGPGAGASRTRVDVDLAEADPAGLEGVWRVQDIDGDHVPDVIARTRAGCLGAYSLKDGRALWTWQGQECSFGVDAGGTLACLAGRVGEKPAATMAPGVDASPSPNRIAALAEELPRRLKESLRQILPEGLIERPPVVPAALQDPRHILLVPGRLLPLPLDPRQPIRPDRPVEPGAHHELNIPSSV